MWGYLKPDWLLSYLQNPKPIRPAGVRPGTGQRHGHQSFPEDTARELWVALKRIGREPKGRSVIKPLSPSREAAIRHLVKERYGCIGCHQLDGQGGRIGPMLDDVGSRLRPSSIRQALVEPLVYSSQHNMPKVIASCAK